MLMRGNVCSCKSVLSIYASATRILPSERAGLTGVAGQEGLRQWDRLPLMHITADLRREKLILDLIRCRTLE